MRSWLRTAQLLLGIGWEIGPAVFLGYAGASAIGFAAPPLLAFGLRPLVDGVVASDRGQVVSGAAFTCLALALAVLAPAAYRWTTIRMRERKNMVIQRRVLTLAATAPRLAHFETPAFWDRLRLLRRGAPDLAVGLSLVFVGPIIVAQLAVTAVLLAQLQPALTLVPVLAVPAGWLARRAEVVRRDAELRTAEDRRTADHLFTQASTAAPAKELRVYGLQAELLDRHRRASQRVHTGLEAALIRSVTVHASGWLLFALAYVGAVVLVLLEAISGRATPGDVALTLGLATAVVVAATRLSELAGSVFRIHTTSEHYHWLAGQAAPATIGEREPPPDRLKEGIELDAVDFGYAGSDRPALCDISLHLPAGGVVAVVGENGAGKTTFVKMLCGMYEPTGGRILVDGVDLTSVDLEAYRQRISAGFQDFARFELLTWEAVGVGDLSRIDNVEAVRTALTRVNADFAERLPDGLETQLGLSWQGGIDLSGGEWQKLALARAMLRTTPLLVILDEPTASLDPQTEHALFEQLTDDARRGRTSGRITVLISHRFSTVRMADMIVVLDQGRIMERGTHDELLAGNGRYAELYRLQAQAYR